MVDALPYLVDYPYGCTEQTLNRFLPTVITQKVLLDMKLDLQDDPGEADEPQRPGDRRRRRAGRRSGSGSTATRCSTRTKFSKMVKDGVQRLTEMQLADGGWGWFCGWGEHSWPHTTAVVVHGLQIAQANDVALVPGRARARRRLAEATIRHEQVELMKNALVKPKPKTPCKEHGRQPRRAGLHGAGRRRT